MENEHCSHESCTLLPYSVSVQTSSAIHLPISVVVRPHSVTSDVIFYVTIFVCMSLGSYYKKIEDPDTKRNYGAGLGLLVACLICGQEIYHSVLMVWGNIIIIKCCDKRYVHQLSIAFTWIYLVYLYFNITDWPYIYWMHQILALRLVGLAFEIYLSAKNKANVETKPSTLSSLKLLSTTDMDPVVIEPTAVDIIAYSYFFIGLHRGPYYRWKIFEDHFNAPFGVLGDCRIITEQKLKKALFCAFVYMVLKTRYSTAIYSEDYFYTTYGSDYRYLYNIPQLLLYFLQHQIVMMLCTAICTEAGFGVYPAKCVPLPGQGPSTAQSLLKLAATTTDVALEQEYNFSMLKTIEKKKLFFGPRMRDTMRAWDMPTRYFFWANTYKQFLKTNKEVRSACAFLAWTIWSGPSLQHLILSATLWVYVSLEAEYSELYDTDGPLKKPWDMGFSLMRMFCLIYLAPCLVVVDASTVLRYYNSIYWSFHFVLLFLMLAAVILGKMKNSS